jgi:hypothetical protein
MLLAFAVLFAGCSKSDPTKPTPSADGKGGGDGKDSPNPDDDLPKDPTERAVVQTASAFMAAVKAKDLDGALKHTEAPFLLGGQSNAKKLATAGELKDGIKKYLDGLKDAEHYPSDFAVAYSWKNSGAEDKKNYASQMDATGPEGYYVQSYIRKPGPVNTGTPVRVLLKMVDKQPRVVGLIE